MRVRAGQIKQGGCDFVKSAFSEFVKEQRREAARERQSGDKERGRELVVIPKHKMSV